jgi:hypothetical protein
MANFSHSFGSISNNHFDMWIYLLLLKVLTLLLLLLVVVVVVVVVLVLLLVLVLVLVVVVVVVVVVVDSILEISMSFLCTSVRRFFRFHYNFRHNLGWIIQSFGLLITH